MAKQASLMLFVTVVGTLYCEGYKVERLTICISHILKPVSPLLTLFPFLPWLSREGGNGEAPTFEVNYSPLAGWSPTVCEECMAAAWDRADMARSVFKVLT